MSKESRRAFVGAVAAGTAIGAQVRPAATARSASRVVGANDRVRVGMIGVGGMGTVHLRAFVKQS